MSDATEPEPDPWPHAMQVEMFFEGEDPLWDKLGPDWRSVLYRGSGDPKPLRLYVRWEMPKDGRPAYITGLCIADNDAAITPTLVRSLPISALERMGSFLEDAATLDQLKEELPPLARALASDADEFAALVATYYRRFRYQTGKPAKEIADHAGVPVATVRGWIREARLRGKLPPGRQGRAG